MSVERCFAPTVTITSLLPAGTTDLCDARYVRVDNVATPGDVAGGHRHRLGSGSVSEDMRELPQARKGVLLQPERFLQW